MSLHVVGDSWESLGLREFFCLATGGAATVAIHTITRCIASLNGLTRTSDARGSDLADDRVTRLAQSPADLGAVFRPLGLQVQFDLRLREPEPWIGPDVAHVEDISVDH